MRELPATDWGYGGLTQAARRAQSGWDGGQGPPLPTDIHLSPSAVHSLVEVIASEQERPQNPCPAWVWRVSFLGRCCEGMRQSRRK